MNTIELVAVALASGILAWSLARHAPRAVRASTLAAQGVLGVATGLLVREISSSALDASDWAAVLAVAVGTLAICVAGGALLSMHRGISPLTGALSLVAGGSSGVVSIARELGGDDRVVAAVQYLRVALITAAMPFVVAVVYGGTAADPSPDAATSPPLFFGLPLIAVIVVAGAVLGHAVRLPAAGLLGPMAITVALELSGLLAGLDVPVLLVQAAALLIVWQTVLDLNRESIRAIRRILPTALTLIVVLNLVVAGFGVLLANAAGLSQLDGYLATSPGGIYAVLGTTLGSESNVAFVMTSQVVRVVLMLFAAPFVAKLFLRFTPRSVEVKHALADAVA
ncbi:AbrB family transcriptional regulator [Mycobacterium barrassiae]|uniref:AbrB family transcriptional regulator n=1 Tax=Mycobacterium barrassiae TaxID=319709 RepID=UPI002265D6F1|nr:AbrB family transcriptional regulator [Mycobacterium barrassiae]MCV7302293.1 AbrB family transcriptional regulator [Mycobacterium barrassiae]